MPLTDTAIRKAKATDKMQRLFDGGGLYLEISPAGGKWWRLKYRFDGKEKRVSLGTYPDTSLASARAKRDEARKLLAAGVDSGSVKKTGAHLGFFSLCGIHSPDNRNLDRTRTAQTFRTWRPIVNSLQTPASTTSTDCACTFSNKSLEAASCFACRLKRSCGDRCRSGHAAGRNQIRENQPDPFFTDARTSESAPTQRPSWPLCARRLPGRLLEKGV